MIRSLVGLLFMHRIFLLQPGQIIAVSPLCTCQNTLQPPPSPPTCPPRSRRKSPDSSSSLSRNSADRARSGLQAPAECLHPSPTLCRKGRAFLPGGRSSVSGTPSGKARHIPRTAQSRSTYQTPLDRLAFPFRQPFRLPGADTPGRERGISPRSELYQRPAPSGFHARRALRGHARIPYSPGQSPVSFPPCSLLPVSHGFISGQSPYFVQCGSSSPSNSGQ